MSESQEDRADRAFLETNAESLREIGGRYWRKEVRREDAAAEIVRLGTSWDQAYLCLTAWDNLFAALEHD